MFGDIEVILKITRYSTVEVYSKSIELLSLSRKYFTSVINDNFQDEAVEMKLNANKKFAYDNEIIRKREKLYNEGDNVKKQELLKINTQLPEEQKIEGEPIKIDRETKLIEEASKSIVNMKSINIKRQNRKKKDKSIENSKFKTPKAGFHPTLETIKQLDKSNSVVKDRKNTMDIGMNNIFKKSVFVDEKDIEENNYDHFRLKKENYSSFIVKEASKEAKKTNAQSKLEMIGVGQKEKEVRVTEECLNKVIEEEKQKWIASSNLEKGPELSLQGTVGKSKKAKLEEMLRRLTELEKKV